MNLVLPQRRTANVPTQRFPVIGVVTPVRNRRQWSIGFAKMMAGQDYPVFKLYIVDSNSTDGTPAALEDLNLPFLQVLPASDSCYWSGATNLGVQQALDDGCEFILTINDDAIIAEDYLSRLIASVVDTEAKIVGSVIAYVDHPGKLWAVGAYNNWNEGAFVQLRDANIWEDEALFDSEASLVPVDYLCGNGSLFHRSVFEQLGLYNEKWTPHYHADSEFTMRAEQAGIARWVSTAARVYNRFSEAADGGFAARNRRFFSFRSANYLRATLYILDSYCPHHLKARALVRFYAKYLHQQDWRIWSRMLRLVRFLGTARDQRQASIKSFFPPLDQHLCAAEDLEILLNLPSEDFVVMCYAYLLRRSGSEEEYASYVNAVANGHSRESIVEGFVKSTEFAVIQGSMREFVLAALKLRVGEKGGIGGGHLSRREAWILDHIEACGSVPSHAEVALATASANRSAIVPAATVSRSEAGSGLTVYFNIDVLCMAVIDPRAGTGVHRYVLNLLLNLATRPEIDLRLFHSARLAESCATLIRQGGVPQLLRFVPAHVRPDSGVVFYPYFPLDGLDARFGNLATVMTVCDIFPLTNPEWFSSEAVSSFRRQMHGLALADHVICISKATEDHLNCMVTGLRATTSFAHLGVKRPAILGPLEAQRNNRRLVKSDETRYFLCVGTIEPRKNLSTVIAAMKLLSQDTVGDLEMWVVGQEGWSITSEQLSTLAGTAAGRVRFLGRVADTQLWSLYAGAVCTVFPSLAEGFGFPIVESFAAGTPVVTGRGSSMAEIGDRGAILVDPLNTTEIADAIRLLATDDRAREILAEQAIEAAKTFNWEECANAHMAVFDTVVRRSLLQAA